MRLNLHYPNLSGPTQYPKNLTWPKVINKQSNNYTHPLIFWFYSNNSEGVTLLNLAFWVNTPNNLILFNWNLWNFEWKTQLRILNSYKRPHTQKLEIFGKIAALGVGPPRLELRGCTNSFRMIFLLLLNPGLQKSKLYRCKKLLCSSLIPLENSGDVSDPKFCKLTKK